MPAVRTLCTTLAVRSHLVEVLLALEHEHRRRGDVSMGLAVPAPVVEADHQVERSGVPVITKHRHVVVDQIRRIGTSRHLHPVVIIGIDIHRVSRSWP